MRYLIECFGKVQKYCIDLFFISKSPGKVVNCQEELRFTRIFLPKSKLAVRAILVKLVDNLAVDEVFYCFADDGGEGDGPVV